MTTQNDLLDSWNQLLVRLNLPASPELGLELLGCYSEHHRVFHTTAHLAHVLGLLAEYGADDRLVLAAWFHDAIYKPGRRDNEAQSARLAHQRLGTLDYPEPDITFVELAIQATAGHGADNQEFAPLQDADLSILGSATADYDRYADAIAREFGQVPGFLYRRGRAAFLESMLARPALYATRMFASRFEAAARRNLARELAMLVDQKRPWN